MVRIQDEAPQVPSWTLAVVGLRNSTFYSRKPHQFGSVPSPLGPSDIHHVYDIPSTYTGSGQTIAVVEYDNFMDSDVIAYTNHYGMPAPNVQRIYVNHACEVCCDKAGQNCVSCLCTHQAPTTPGSGRPEVTLDIELALAIAPKATILVYIAANIFTLSLINQISIDNKASVVSTSWGLPEDDFFPKATGELAAESLIFKQWAAQGQSNFVAAGDNGAFDDYHKPTTLMVDDPGSQPFSTSVGGTKLLLQNGNYLSESTWWQGTKQGGGGGGVSRYWSIPSYQVGVISPSSLGSNKMRNVPDISFDADPNTGYNIFVKGTFQVYGGTSCAAPIWAGFTALVNEYRSTVLNAGRIGFVNPVLYALGQRPDYNYYFHDIKDGSTNGYYPAVTGYDLATGWGTIKGQALLFGMGGCPKGELLLNGNCIHSSGVSLTNAPTNIPTFQMTNLPTIFPTNKPANPPIQKKKKRNPTRHRRHPPPPTKRPTLPTLRPTNQPTHQPTQQPTHQPTDHPTSKPTSYPTLLRKNKASVSPTSTPMEYEYETPSVSG